MQIIHQFGDSITIGHGLGTLATNVAANNPLYVFRSIQSSLNNLLAENDAPVRVSRSGDAYYYPHSPGHVAAMVADGRIKKGDWVIFSDAGGHVGLQNPPDPDAYQAELETLLDAALQPGIKVAHTTTFDVASVVNRPNGYTPTPFNARYNEVFGTRTLNDAIRAAVAAKPGAILIDVDAGLTALRAHTMGQYAVPIESSDGIHYNFWGQTGIAGLYLIETGARDYVKSYVQLADVVLTNWQTMHLGDAPQYWTATAAIDCMLRGLLP